MHDTIVSFCILYHRLFKKSSIPTGLIGRLILSEYSLHAADAGTGGFFFGYFEAFATFA